MPPAELSPSEGRLTMTFEIGGMGSEGLYRFLWREGKSRVKVFEVILVNGEPSMRDEPLPVADFPVWDFERGVPSIPFEPDPFEARCREWLAATSAEDHDPDDSEEEPDDD